VRADLQHPVGDYLRRAQQAVSDTIFAYSSTRHVHDRTVPIETQELSELAQWLGQRGVLSAVEMEEAAARATSTAVASTAAAALRARRHDGGPRAANPAETLALAISRRFLEHVLNVCASDCSDLDVSCVSDRLFADASDVMLEEEEAHRRQKQ